MHLVVAHHGLWGNHTHLDFLLKNIQEEAAKRNLHGGTPGEVEFMNCKLNEGNLTYAGVDVCGGRLTFKHRTVYANVINDPIVSHLSSSILEKSPFKPAPTNPTEADNRFYSPYPQYPSLVLPKPDDDQPKSPITEPTDQPFSSSSETSPPSTPQEQPTQKSTFSKLSSSFSNFNARQAAFMAFSPVFVVVALSTLTGMWFTFHAKRAHIVWNTSGKKPITTTTNSANVENEKEKRSLRDSAVSLEPSPYEYTPSDLENLTWVKNWMLKRAHSKKESEEAEQQLQSTFSPTSHERDSKSFILESLNLLSWNRFHVKAAHKRAHAAIIKRSPEFAGSEDVVRHFVQEVFFKA
ncbi:hypothetical protein HDV05_005400 [Chytridiales sp. JEL 0842]|nr:hypothetical protein HDV05_005400 [Chytridiales sp. JEL 0842]